MRAFGLFTARTGSPLAAAVLMTASFALAPQAARAQSPQEPSAADVRQAVEEEMRIERTCEDWQKVRQCASTSGEVRYECVAKSPLAKFWAMLSNRPEDDEVEVKVVRRAPEGSAEPTAEAAQAPAAGVRTASVEGRQTKKVVKVRQGEELPACRSQG